jgi:hypothetical protein
MLKSVRTKSALIAVAITLAVPAFAAETPAPQESPWAMRAPSPEPQAAPSLTAAQEAALKEAEKGTPDQQELARNIAAAMDARDYDAMKLLIAPSTIKCIGKNEDFLQDRLQKQFGLPISKKFQLTVNKMPPKMINPSKYSTYPMLPTYFLGMEFTTEDGETATVNLPIGEENGKWYEAQPCPTQAGMQRFAEIQRMRAVGRERAKKAVTQLKDPLKSQLVEMVSKHDTVSAWKLCMSEQHLDFPTCRGIVAILAGDPSY